MTMAQHEQFKRWTDEYGPDVVAVTIAGDTLVIPGNQEDAR